MNSAETDISPNAQDEASRRAAEGEAYRLEKRLLSAMGHAVRDFGLISEGDRILVGLSGGKDSLVLLALLKKLQERAPVKFSLTAMNVDMGQPGFDAAPLKKFVDELGVERRFIAQDVWSVARAKVRPGKSMCPICSRLRRGILYTQAFELGCTKIALGHHREDLIETLLLSALYAGALKSMPPLLRSDDGRNTVIRPMVYCPEAEIAAYARLRGFPVAPRPPCETPDLQRSRVKELIHTLAAEHPAVPGNLLNALSHVVPTHLLDRELLSAWNGCRQDAEAHEETRGKLPPGASAD
jgi:Predicted ATPase of the PP-loop superfamily implicated in cell cycle control